MFTQIEFDHPLTSHQDSIEHSLLEKKEICFKLNSNSFLAFFGPFQLKMEMVKLEKLESCASLQGKL